MLGHRAVEARLVLAAPGVQDADLVAGVDVAHRAVAVGPEPVVDLQLHLLVQRPAEEHQGDVPVRMAQVHVGGLLGQ